MVRRRPWAVAAAVALIVFTMGACVPTVRVAILQRLGWALVAEDPLTRADAIVLTVDVGRAGVLEAADSGTPRNRHPRRRLFRIAGIRGRRIPPARYSGRGACRRNHARFAGCRGIGGGEDADAGYGHRRSRASTRAVVCRSAPHGHRGCQSSRSFTARQASTTESDAELSDSGNSSASPLWCFRSQPLVAVSRRHPDPGRRAAKIDCRHPATPAVLMRRCLAATAVPALHNPHRWPML